MMKKISQKMLYGAELQEMSYRFGYERYIWAEELVNKTLYIYKDSIKKEAAKLNTDYEECGLVYVNIAFDNYLRCIDAKCSEDGEIVFISEKQFNQHWKDMLPAINDGISNAEKDISADELLDLHSLNRKNSVPVIRDYKIIYEQKQSPETDKAHRARQSAMDNPNLIFCYSALKSSNVYHDKTCDNVKYISDKNFRASSVPPEGYYPCHQCHKEMYLRQLCNNKAKMIPALKAVFQSENIQSEMIQKLVEKGYRFTSVTRNELYVFCNEDYWIVKRNENSWSLWHNNYIRTSDTERYITNGYHSQGFKKQHLVPLLRYIGQYTWEGHLQAELAELKRQQEEQRTICEQTIQNNEADLVYTKKENIFVKIGKWLKKYFKKENF